MTNQRPLFTTDELNDADKKQLALFTGMFATGCAFKCVGEKGIDALAKKVANPNPPANATDTSQEAAKKVAPRSAQDEHRLIVWLNIRGDNGATDEEIQTHFGWSGDYERPRRWRWSHNTDPPAIKLNGEKRLLRSGGRGRVWVRV